MTLNQLINTLTNLKFDNRLSGDEQVHLEFANGISPDVIDSVRYVAGMISLDIVTPAVETPSNPE